MIAPGWGSNAALDLFDRLDITDSGTITSRDLEEHSRRMLAALQRSADLRETAPRLSGEKLQRAFADIWKHVFAPMDTNNDKEIRVTEFIDAVGGSTAHAAELEESLHPLAETILQTYDVSNNNVLLKDEVLAWLQEFGFSEARAAGYYEQLDRANNGVVSLDELSHALHEYAANPVGSPLGAALLFGAQHQHTNTAYAEAQQRVKAWELSPSSATQQETTAPRWGRAS